MPLNKYVNESKILIIGNMQNKINCKYLVCQEHHNPPDINVSLQVKEGSSQFYGESLFD